MNDDAGDLRDRFRRTDYQSTTVRQAPPTINLVSELSPTPNTQTAPTVLNPIAKIEVVKVATDPNSLDLSAALPITPTTPVELPKPAPAPAMPMPAQVLTMLSPNPINFTQPTTLVIPDQSPLMDSAQPVSVETPINLTINSPAMPDKAPETPKTSFSAVAKALIVIMLVASLSGTAYYGSKKYLDISIKRKAGVLAATSATNYPYTSSSVGFDIIYPTNMPSGYRIAPGSFDLANGSLTFTINTDEGLVVSVSEQLIPSGMSSADQLVPAPSGIKVTDVEDIELTGGKSAYSKWDGKLLTSTVIGKTWIIINATNVSKEQAIAITQTFKSI